MRKLVNAGLAVGFLEAAENRETEGGSLTGAGLGGGDDVSTLGDEGNGLRLNRRRLHITHPLCAVDNGFEES